MPYIFVVKYDHPLPQTVSLQELQRYRMVGGCFVENNRFVVTKLEEVGRKPMTRGFDSENSNYTKAILKESLQFALLPMAAVIEDLKTKSLRIIDVKKQKIQKRDIFMEVHQDSVLAKTKKQLVNVSTQCFRKLQDY